MSFVPDEFEPPVRLTKDAFTLEPLGPQHNEGDYAAWSSSIEHIRATPGFPDGDWPQPMTAEENLRDLERHAADFAARKGFTYTVRDGDRIIGCLYIYPQPNGAAEALVSSWVTADRAELDAPLRAAVREWLRDEWPFDRFDYG